MEPSKTPRATDITRRGILRQAASVSLLAAIAVNIAAAVLFWRYWQAIPTQAAHDPVVVHLQQGQPLTPPDYVPPPVPTPTPDRNPHPSPTPRPTPRSDSRPLVGIIAGHLHNDSGAVCEDTGLQEVHITTAVAEGVAEYLGRQGYRVEVLAEFDPLLPGYEAAALVSVHADSCLIAPGLTGFKVARSQVSAIPDIEDALVDCLYEAYGDATGLPTHDYTITENMTAYHAFRKVAPQTPSAIIELGFLYQDRHILTNRQDLLIQGVAEGITCFLSGEWKDVSSANPSR